MRLQIITVHEVYSRPQLLIANPLQPRVSHLGFGGRNSSHTFIAIATSH